MKKLLFLSVALLSVLALVFGITSCADDDDDDTEESVYALVNIPFKEFFASETNDGDFDAYSSATQKAANGSISYGTYHTQTNASKAVTGGITYPVKIATASLPSLTGNKITDDTASLEITTTGRGASTTRYSGKQNLFQSPDYSSFLRLVLVQFGVGSGKSLLQGRLLGQKLFQGSGELVQEYVDLVRVVAPYGFVEYFFLYLLS